MSKRKQAHCLAEISANVALNGLTTSQWRRIFERKVERGWVFDPQQSKTITVPTPNMYFASLFGVSEPAVSRWGISLKPGMIKASKTRWGLVTDAQTYLEHLFFDDTSQWPDERREFRQAYENLPAMALGEAKVAFLSRGLAELPNETMISLNHSSVHADFLANVRADFLEVGFVRDVLTFVRQDRFKHSSLLVDDLAKLSAIYSEKPGYQAIADAISDKIATRLLANNDIAVSVDVIVDLLHVCELRYETEAFEFVRSMQVSEGRRWQEVACRVCRVLKRRDVENAASLLEVLRGNLDKCNSDTKGMFYLHVGRLLLHEARGVAGSKLEDAITQFRESAKWLSSISLTHPFLPHVLAYGHLARCLNTRTDESAKTLSIACDKVRLAGGDRCLDPGATVAEWLRR